MATATSSHKSRSSYLYSPLKVESDQKDIIIAHLKDEALQLKKNEQQFYLLEEQYRVLDAKYRQLSEDKAHADAEFGDRHQIALRTICQLRGDVDGLKADLRERQLEIDDLETDEATLKGQLDERLIQLDKLKSDLKSLVADGNQLAAERSRMETVAGGVKADNDRLSSNLKGLEVEGEGIRRKNADVEKYCMKLESEEAMLKEKIMSYENENNTLYSEVSNLQNEGLSLENQISAAQAETTALQTGLAEQSAASDKFKSEALHCQRAAQAQSLKNGDIAKQISHTEGVLRARLNQLDEGKREVQAIRSQNDNLNKLNSRLQDDIRFCREHLQNVSMLNSDLLVHLERFSEEDEFVRTIIDRRQQVSRARARVQECAGTVTRIGIIAKGKGF